MVVRMSYRCLLSLPFNDATVVGKMRPYYPIGSVHNTKIRRASRARTQAQIGVYEPSTLLGLHIAAGCLLVNNVYTTHRRASTGLVCERLGYHITSYGRLNTHPEQRPPLKFLPSPRTRESASPQHPFSRARKAHRITQQTIQGNTFVGRSTHFCFHAGPLCVAEAPRGTPPARDAMKALEKKLMDGLARIDNELRESQHVAAAVAAAADTQVGVFLCSSCKRSTSGQDVPRVFLSRFDWGNECCYRFSWGACPLGARYFLYTFVAHACH